MIIVDVHEPRSIAEFLEDLGVKVKLMHLMPGDYVIGRMGVERKSVRDFFSSLISKRLFDQVKRLREAYEEVALIVEGDLSFVEMVSNPNSIWGALTSLVIDRGIPVFFTPDEENTARLLYVLHKREVEGMSKALPAIRYKPKMLSDDEWRIFIVEGLPNVGRKTAERLLSRFKTVRRIFNASATELMRIPEIGEKKARRIVELISGEFGAQKKLEDNITKS